MPDRSLEDELRDALRADVDELPVRLRASDVRARVRPPRRWWSMSAAMAGAAVVVAAVLIGVYLFAKVPPVDVGTPPPSLPSAFPSPHASASPSMDATPSAALTPSPEPIQIDPGVALLVRRSGNDLVFGQVDRSGLIRRLGTIGDPLVDLPAGFEPDLGPILSAEGLVALRAVDRDRAESRTFVLDLRVPGALPINVEGFPGLGTWGPDGRLAAQGADRDSVTIFDPSTQAVTEIDYGEEFQDLRWLDAGDGFLITPKRGPFEVFRLDGTREATPDRLRPTYPTIRNPRPVGARFELTYDSCGYVPPNECRTLIDEIEWVPHERVSWDAQGTGLWALDQQSVGDATLDDLLIVEHYDRPGRPERVMATEPLGTIVEIDTFILSPDDTFALVQLHDGRRLVVLDLESGTASTTDIPEGTEVWTLAGWGPGFPPYPNGASP